MFTISSQIVKIVALRSIQIFQKKNNIFSRASLKHDDHNNLANLFKEITIYFRKQIVHRFQSVSIRAGKLYAYAIYL